MLLAFSTLGVILVGDAPGHSISGVFKPLHEDMIAGPWPNRQLLLLPLSTANALVTQGMELRTRHRRQRAHHAAGGASGRRVELHQQHLDAPARGARPALAAGGRSGGRTGLSPAAAAGRGHATQHARSASPSGAAAVAPDARGARTRAGTAGTGRLLTRYIQQLAKLTGMVSCCLFDVATGA
jgi:hypothetical protein